MESASEAPLSQWKSNRRILIIAGPKDVAGSALSPHEVLHCKNIECSLDLIATSRPDMVVYFNKGKTDDLEEHVMTWLIEGFRGKVLLFDPANKVKDFQTLLESQVVDEYLCGPVSLSRFVSIVKSQLAQDMRFAAPRAMTTFDLFRNLFDRGLNAIFFFDQELNRCIAANLRAEQITGYTLYELHRLGLRDLCVEKEYEPTLRIIRRAGRHYYDARGNTLMKDRGHHPLQVAFSCGVFNFGRKTFVKLEVQSSTEVFTGEETTARRQSFMEALDRGFLGGSGKESPLSLILCKIQPVHGSIPESEEETKMLEKVGHILEKNIRQSDTMARFSRYQFAVLLPKTSAKKAETLVERLRFRLDSLPEMKQGLYLVEIGAAHCPSEAYPFMHLLHSAEMPGMQSPFHH